MKIVLPCRRNAYFQGSRLKKTTKNRHNIDKNSLQIRDRQIKYPKIAQKLDLRGSWAPFGRGLECFGASLGRSWTPRGRFGSVQNRVVFKHWAKMVSKRPFGLIFDRFGEGLGRLLGHSLAIWGGLELN